MPRKPKIEYLDTVATLEGIENWVGRDLKGSSKDAEELEVISRNVSHLKTTISPEFAIAECPHCKKVLGEEWLKRAGASLMGKSGGRSKARGGTAMSAAAKKRWAKVREEKAKEVADGDGERV